MENIWTLILEKLKPSMSQHIFETWFEPTEYCSLTNDILTVKVPNELFCEWIEQNYGSQIHSIIETVHSAPLDLQLQPYDMVVAEPSGNGNGRSCIEIAENGLRNPVQLNRKYTFDTFVVGSGNQFAHAAARAVADNPAVTYNPLFVYGGVGLGKTHLMHGIGHALLSKFPSLRIIYLPAEQFMNEMIKAFQFNRVSEFREKYRNMDVLMIDDIQFLANRERTQVEFFHTFNALYESQKQIVISSDLFPKEIPTLEERLRSRFEMGLIADIQPPDLETKIAILYKKSEINNIQLPNDVAMFIAENIKSNIRELEGCLIRVSAMASLMKKKLSLSFASDVLKDIVDSEEKKIDVEKVQKVVAKYFGIKQSAMRSKTRTKDIAYPRQIAMYLSRELTGESLPEIGRLFGGKDHTTILYACKKMQKLLKTDISLKKNIEMLQESIQSS